MTGRRGFFIGACGAALLASGTAGAQQPRSTIPRIGFLAGRLNPSVAGFDEGLRELGWIDGRTIRIERRIADGSNEQSRIMATELVALGVDAIYVTATQAVAAVRETTAATPVVFSMLADPVELGWETNFARPAGNLTGIAGVATSEIAGKRIELLLAAVPGARRMGLLYTPRMLTAELAVRGSEAAARMLDIQLRVLPIERDAAPEPAFAELSAWGAQALVVTQSQLLATQPLQGRIVALAAAARLPTIYGEPDWVDFDGLMTYVPDAHDMGRRAAWFMDRILRGAKPADLPIERPARIQLRVNLRAARAIGLALPPSFLARADEVIE
ncbi:MAG: ABC transporter substrate-binding protein [Alphaproteobacteria bacterium]|nr:ABC transporter substrate-binding protein [Alphaproteobacteria bacterium]